MVAQRLIVTLSMAAWPWSIGLFLPLALLLFPTGRLLSPRWRWAVIGIVATSPSVRPGDGRRWQRTRRGTSAGYLSFSSYDTLQPLWTITELRNLVALLLAITCLTIRYRRADEVGRRQLLWLLLASVIAHPLRDPMVLHRRHPDPCALGDPLDPGGRRCRDRALPAPRHSAGRVARTDLGLAVVGCRRRLRGPGRDPGLIDLVAGRAIGRDHGPHRPDHRSDPAALAAARRSGPVRRPPRPGPGRVPRRRATVGRPARRRRRPSARPSASRMSL